MDGRSGSPIQRASDFSSDRWLIAWALGYAAIGASSLLVPIYALALGGGPLVVGALEATAGLAGVPGALIWGALADRTGRRRGFVLLSLAGSGVVLSLFPVTDSLSVLLVINTVLWFLVAAATPVVTLFMIEQTPERAWEERIGLLNAYQRYGWVGGLVAGTAWLGVGTAQFSPLLAQRSFFLVCAVAAIGATPLAFYWLPPEATTSPSRFARSPRSVARLVTGSGRYLKLVPYAPARATVALRDVGLGGFFGRFSPSLRRYFLTAALFSTGAAMFFGPVPAYLTELQYSSAYIFGFFILASLFSAVLFVPVGRLAARRTPKSLQLSALGIRVLLFPAVGALALLSGYAIKTVGLGVGFILLGITWAVIAVTAAGLVSRTAKPSLRGEALGIYTGVAGIGGGIGGLVGGYVAMVFGYLAAFSIAGGLVLLSLVVLAGVAFEFETGAEAHERSD